MEFSTKVIESNLLCPLPSGELPARRMVFVTGVPGSGKTYCVNDWISQVEQNQGCKVDAVVINGLPWLEGTYAGCPCRFVGRWVGRHPDVQGGRNALDARGKLNPCAAQGSDRIAPGVGTFYLGMWLRKWAEGGVRLVVVDSILKSVLAFQDSSVVVAAHAAGYQVTVLELDVDRVQVAAQLLSRDGGDARVGQIVKHATERWLSPDNPWRRDPWHAPVPSQHPVVQYSYFLMAPPEAIASFKRWTIILPEIEMIVMTPHADDAMKLDLDSPHADDVTCMYCHLAINKGQVVTCVACDSSWHSSCYAAEEDVLSTSILCFTCEYQGRVRGGCRPRDCLEIGQILAGLGTAAQQVCELQQEGHPFKNVRNVYTVEIDSDALMYVLRLAKNKGYEGMRPEVMHTDWLNDTCDIQLLPAVDVLAMTLLCNKHSPLLNGHCQQQRDMSDAQTKAITVKCCALLRRKVPAAKFIIMENVVHWLQSAAYQQVQEAYLAGGYRVVIEWRCRNQDLGVPEHRTRVLLMLAHASQEPVVNESVAYRDTLEKLIQMLGHTLRRRTSRQTW